MTNPDVLGDLAARVPAAGTGAAIVAVAGPVAVGKSTLAAGLADHLRSSGRRVEVVATDGFLLANVDLEARGLLARKGFPETYDLDRMSRLVDAARRGTSPLHVPVYSHVTYDVEAAPLQVPGPDVLVLEGVVALQRPLADLGIYVDAAEEHVIRWYVERFLSLVEAAREEPESFYREWTDLDPTAVADLARAVWDAVNHPNLVDHIAPTRALADLVVHKGPDHTVLSVEETSP